jgi:hypothetical protein
MLSITPGIHPDYSQRTYRIHMKAVNENHGWVAYSPHFGREGICAADFALTPPDPLYVQSLHRYDTANTRVVFYVAPLPDCDRRATSFARHLRTLGWSPPLVLPWTEFSDDRHLAMHGAEVNSGNLAQELLTLDSRRRASASSGSEQPPHTR